MGPGKVHDAVKVLRADFRDAHRVLGDAAVAGEGVDRSGLGVLFQLFDDGVLAASAADYEYIHNVSLRFFAPFLREPEPTEENEEQWNEGAFALGRKRGIWNLRRVSDGTASCR